ncbi:MAG: DUF2752 domain-containing protein [Armatimonadota bacterium]
MKRWLIILSFPLFILAARFIPFDHLPSTCLLVHATGYPCPTCGMTRSVMAIVLGDMHRAMIMNPLGFVFMGLTGLWWVISVYEEVTGKFTQLSRWVYRNNIALIIAGLVFLFAFGALRILILVHNGATWH